MMAGLSWAAWALILAAMLPALVLATVFYHIHRDE